MQEKLKAYVQVSGIWGFDLHMTKIKIEKGKMPMKQMTQQVLTLSFVSWTVRKLEFGSMVIMSSSFFAISFLFSGLLRTCSDNY